MVCHLPIPAIWPLTSKGTKPDNCWTKYIKAKCFQKPICLRFDVRGPELQPSRFNLDIRPCLCGVNMFSLRRRGFLWFFLIPKVCRFIYRHVLSLVCRWVVESWKTWWLYVGNRRALAQINTWSSVLMWHIKGPVSVFCDPCCFYGVYWHPKSMAFKWGNFLLVYRKSHMISCCQQPTLWWIEELQPIARGCSM